MKQADVFQIRFDAGKCPVNKGSMRKMPAESVHCCVTSPPYWGLRDYGVTGQMGLEETPEEWVSKMVDVFQEVRRALRDDGTMWINVGDSYNSPNTHSGDSNKVNWGIKRVLEAKANIAGTTKTLKPKDLVGQPWRLAFALQADGWYLRSDIIWSKPNPMPESVKDRPTKAHEYLFLLSKNERYYYDSEAIREKRMSNEDANSFRGVVILMVLSIMLLWESERLREISDTHSRGNQVGR
jgi:DNA modification methylase